jgi:hypothetical protein
VAAGVTAQTSDRPGPPEIRVRIEVEQAAYEVGDSIRLRVTLQNVSSRDLQVLGRGTAFFVELVVSDANGSRIEPRLPDHHRVQQAGGPARTWKAQTDLPVGGGKWIDLSYWGYELKSPGEYTITGIPVVLSLSLETAATVSSNEVRITLE